MPFVYPGCLLLIAISIFRWKIFKFLNFIWFVFLHLLTEERLLVLKFIESFHGIAVKWMNIWDKNTYYMCFNGLPYKDISSA